MGVLLIDVVLGYASHPDPGRRARPGRPRGPAPPGPSSRWWATCCGTEADPQVLAAQEAALRRGRCPPGRPPTPPPRRRLAASPRADEDPPGHLLHRSPAAGWCTRCSWPRRSPIGGTTWSCGPCRPTGPTFFREPRVAGRGWCRWSGAPDEAVETGILRYAAALADGLRDAGPADIHHAEDCLSARSLLALRAEGRVPAVVRTIHHVDDFRQPGARRVPARVDRGRRPPRLRQPPLGRARGARPRRHGRRDPERRRR